MQVHASQRPFFVALAQQAGIDVDELMRECSAPMTDSQAFVASLRVALDANGQVRALRFRDMLNQYPRRVRLDLSPLTALETLDVSADELDLEARNNDALKSVDVGFCHLTHLELPPRVEHLDCTGNPLLHFDAALLPELRTLKCLNTTLEELDVSPLAALEELSCGWNDNGYYREGAPGPRLTKLVLGQHPKLTRLAAGNWLFPGTPLGSRLQAIDLSGLPALEQLDLDECQIRSLDLRENRRLKRLSCRNTPIGELDLRHNLELEQLNVEWTALTRLDVSAQTALVSLDCGSKQFAGLDLRGAEALRILSCCGGLPELDISGQPHLEQLWIEQSKIETLDLRANLKLREVTLKANRRLSIIHCAERQKQTIPGLRKFFKLSKPTKNPAKMDAYTLHEFVEHYNWDEGVDKLVAAIENPSCSLATLLTVYWRARPHYYLQYATDREALEDASSEAFELIRLIEQRALEGKYRPVDHIAWVPGDWMEDPYPELSKQRAIPEHMIELSAVATHA